MSGRHGAYVDMVSWLTEKAAERVANGMVWEALECYHKLLQIGRHDRQLVKRVHIRMAELLLEMGELHRAETHLLEVVAFDGTSAYAHSLLSRVYTELCQWNNAVQHAHSACQLSPEASENHHMLGRALLYAGDWTNGCAALERAVELDPNNVLAICDLAMADAQQGRFEKAERALRRAVSRHRTVPVLSETLALVMRIRHEQGEHGRRSTDAGGSDGPMPISPFSHKVCSMLAESLATKRYPQTAIEGAMRLCLDFERARGVGQSNPMVMAAACEYTISRLMGLTGVTQTRVAEHYGVSTAGVSAKYRAMIQWLQLVERDPRYVSCDACSTPREPSDT